MEVELIRSYFRKQSEQGKLAIVNVPRQVQFTRIDEHTDMFGHNGKNLYRFSSGVCHSAPWNNKVAQEISMISQNKGE